MSKVSSEKSATYTVNKSTDDAIIEQAKAILRSRINNGLSAESFEVISDYLQVEYSQLDHEAFGLIYCNNQNIVIKTEVIATGTIDSCIIHIREVIKEVIKNSANAVFIFHNHPSDVAEFSNADRKITTKIKNALSLIDVRLLDHILITKGGCKSGSAQGII